MMFLKGDDMVKCEIIIDPEREEEIIIYAKEKTKLIEEIERLAKQDSRELLGYKGSEIIKLDPKDIYLFTIIDNKIYAICEREKYLIKERLYSLEEKLPGHFVRINQSCIGNIKKMERFDTSISGTLKIRFKNGYSDYVSRRQLKIIKERLGI